MVTTQTAIILPLMIFAAAVLYSSVGHAGASGYLASMALLSVPVAVMKPSALCLNILVAGIASVAFYRAGCFSWSLWWPFALASIPAAFLGGRIALPGIWFRPLLGIVLFFAAYRLFTVQTFTTTKPTEIPKLPLALLGGAVIGLVSGLTGTGGGIFLSPLLLFMNWSDTRQASGVSALFILANSISGLAGQSSAWKHIPPSIAVWALAAVAGGLIGSHYGSMKLGNSSLRKLLAVVLVVAGLKLLFAK